jgi:hypothetical protein
MPRGKVARETRIRHEKAREYLDQNISYKFTLNKGCNISAVVHIITAELALRHGRFYPSSGMLDNLLTCL